MSFTSPVFDWVSLQLAARLSFTRLQARGTVRLVLKRVGLDAGALTQHELKVILRTPDFVQALEMRGVSDAPGVLEEVGAELEVLTLGDPEVADEAPEDIFGRLGPE